MKKVNKDVIKEWMSKRVVELLGFDDDVVVDYAFGMLDAPVSFLPVMALRLLYCILLPILSTRL